MTHLDDYHSEPELYGFAMTVCTATQIERLGRLGRRCYKGLRVI